MDRTNNGRDPLPQELSQADSFGTFMPGGSEVDAECSTLAEPSVDGHGMRLGGHAQAMSSARQHLAAVVQEISKLQEQLLPDQKQAFEDAINQQQQALDEATAIDWSDGAVPNAPGRMELAEEDLLPPASHPLQAAELQRRVKHLEVDRDAARSRVKRLEGENEALVAALGRMEAEMRSVRQNLEESKRRLKHREVDLRQLKGLPLKQEENADGRFATTEASFDAGPSPDAAQVINDARDSCTKCACGVDVDPNSVFCRMCGIKLNSKDALACPVLNVRAQLGPVGQRKASGAQPKQQLLAALNAAQSELHQENKRREKLEKRMQKDRERLQRVAELAEKQRDDLTAVRQRNAAVEEYSGECERRLKQCLSKTNSLHAALHGSGGDGGDGGGGGGGGSPPSLAGSGTIKLERQQSAPTILPSVVAPGRGR